MINLIFKNGNILTQSAPSVSEAILVKNGYIEAVGNLSDIENKAAEDTQIIDLHGQTLMPAFNDAHIHIWKVGDLLSFMLDLRGVNNLAEMQERIVDFAVKNPKNTWILARGFNETSFPDGQMPSRFDLDAVVPNRPCYVIRTCAHVAILNSKALDICGIDMHTPVPEGGEIRRAVDLTGVLSETALGLAQKFLPKPSPTNLRTMVLAAQNALLEKGIAAATDPAVMPDLLAVYKAMDANKELIIRINAVPIVVPDGATEALPLPELYTSDFLAINTVKFFADGGLSGKTAALKGFYKNSKDKGVLRLTEEFFTPLAQKAQAAGFKIATHAIGDAAIDMVLKVYKTIAKDNYLHLEHRIEHLAFPSKSNLKRMRQLGIHCVTQPIFLYELGQNFRHYLPSSYLNRVYPFRTVLDAGVNLAFSSDAPVVKDFNPLMGIQNAVKRIDNQGFSIATSEQITVQAALFAYTLGAAKANDDGAIMGSIDVGKRADFAILDKNPLNTEGGKLSEIQVKQVWIMGNLRFTKAD